MSRTFALPTPRSAIGSVEQIQIPAELPLTQHAQVRIQQRGVKRTALDCLLAFGTTNPDHRGCQIYTFDTRSLERVARQGGPELARLAMESRDLYAVVDSDSTVVTTGHRYRRVRRDVSLSAVRPRSFQGHPDRVRPHRRPMTDLA